VTPDVSTHDSERALTVKPAGFRSLGFEVDENSLHELLDGAGDDRDHGDRNLILLELLFEHSVLPEEACALRWEQIDMFHGCLTLDRQTGPHVIELNHLEMGTLRALKLYGSGDRNQPGDPMFTNRRGHPLTRRMIRRIIDRAAVRAGLKAGKPATSICAAAQPAPAAAVPQIPRPEIVRDRCGEFRIAEVFLPNLNLAPFYRLIKTVPDGDGHIHDVLAVGRALAPLSELMEQLSTYALNVEPEYIDLADDEGSNPYSMKIVVHLDEQGRPVPGMSFIWAIGDEARAAGDVFHIHGFTDVDTARHAAFQALGRAPRRPRQLASSWGFVPSLFPAENSCILERQGAFRIMQAAESGKTATPCYWLLERGRDARRDGLTVRAAAADPAALYPLLSRLVSKELRLECHVEELCDEDGLESYSMYLVTHLDQQGFPVPHTTYIGVYDGGPEDVRERCWIGAYLDKDTARRVIYRRQGREVPERRRAPVVQLFPPGGHKR
jgi:hypothetical protein